MIEHLKNWLVGLPITLSMIALVYVLDQYPAVGGFVVFATIVTVGTWLIGALIRTARDS